MQLLLNDVEELVLERDICRGTANQYRRAVNCYSEFLGNCATRLDLQENPINRWLVAISERMAPETVKGRKAGITALWNWLATIGEVKSYNPNRLRRIRLPEHLPESWAVSDVKTLLAAAENVRGTLRSGLPGKRLLRAWILIGYEAGLRPGDIRRLPAKVPENRLFSIVQHKTQRQHVFELSEPACEALRDVAPFGTDALQLPKSTFRRWELALFREAKKLGFERKRGQGLGTLRKTNATEICREHGITESARSLGHVSGTEIARKHYVAPSAIKAPAKPPRLDNGRTGTRQDDKAKRGDSDT